MTVSGTGTSGLLVATAINSGTLTIVRESDTQVRIVGFSGVLINAIAFGSGTASDNSIDISFSRAAFRTPATISSVKGDDQVGVAEVVASRLIEFTSGSTALNSFASGVSFQIKLTGNTFNDKANGLLDSGTSNGAFRFFSTAADLEGSGITFLGLVSPTDSGLLTVTVFGAVDFGLARQILNVTIPAEALTAPDSTAIVVLTATTASILTARPKLEIVFLEE